MHNFNGVRSGEKEVEIDNPYRKGEFDMESIRIVHHDDCKDDFYIRYGSYPVLLEFDIQMYTRIQL